MTMKPRSPFALLTFLLLGLVPCLCFAQLGPPKITCSQPTFDWGTEDNANQVKHTFVVKNEGASTLTIDRVKPACGCTVANISSKTLEPGQTSEIAADLSLKGRTGLQSKTMTVYSNDPQQPTLILTLKGNATSDIMVTPTSVPLGNALLEGQVVTKEVKITCRKPTVIKSVVPANNLVTTELVTVKPGTDYIIKVTNSGNIPPGGISDSITVTFDDENNPTQRITVFGKVLDKLSVSPNPLKLKENISGVNVDRTIYVRAAAVKNFQVLGAEWPGSLLTPTIANLGAGGFTVSFNGINATKVLDGSEIIIRTDVEDREEIRVPVAIEVAGTAATPPPAPRPTVPSTIPGIPTPATPVVPRPAVPAIPAVPSIPAVPAVPAK